MNSFIVLGLVIFWLIFGYRFYSRFIEKRLRINDKNQTPAVKNKDRVDFSPAKRPLLIGHHFEAIAGAGPIIGPILAVSYFGWLPVVLWLSLSSVLIGAMHDYVSLIASVRNKAEGVSSIAKKTLNSRAGTLFAVMILVTLILIITVFSVSTAESIANKTELIIPLITINIVAVFFGYGVEKLKLDYKSLTIISLIIIAFSVWIGIRYPIDLSFLSLVVARNILITLILIYAGIASIVPVWILLRPRDFLSAIHLSLLMLLGIVSVFLVRPEINAPGFISNPIFPLWPILFITVASLIGAMMVNQFILTTVDSSTRLGRFIVSESLITKLKKRKILVTLLLLIPAWLLAITNSYETIWRLFGTSNQLIAAITMIAISAFFISKKINVKFIIIPAVLVLGTTLSALLYLTFRQGGYISQGSFVLAGISMLMFVLGIFVAKEGFDALRKKK